MLSIGITIVLSAMGIAISAYFSYSTTERIPTLLIGSDRTPIINSKMFPNASLRVTRADDVAVQGDVTALRLFFWNAGKQSIKPGDVLRPLTISLDDKSGEILDYKILRVSRPDIVRIDLTPTSESPIRNLVVGFNILEEDDGFVSQIIYAGNSFATVRISGAVEKPSRIGNNETVLAGRIRNEALNQMPVYIAIFIGLLAVGSIGFNSVVRLGAWRNSIMSKIDKGTAPPTELLKYYGAWFVPHLLVGMLILLVILGVFIAQVREAARTNILDAVPSSIKP